MSKKKVKVNVGNPIDVEVKEVKDPNLVAEMTRSRIVVFAIVATGLALPSSGVISYLENDFVYLLGTAGGCVPFWTSIFSYYFGKRKKDEKG